MQLSNEEAPKVTQLPSSPARDRDQEPIRKEQWSRQQYGACLFDSSLVPTDSDLEVCQLGLVRWH